MEIKNRNIKIISSNKNSKFWTESKSKIKTQRIIQSTWLPWLVDRILGAISLLPLFISLYFLLLFPVFLLFSPFPLFFLSSWTYSRFESRLSVCLSKRRIYRSRDLKCVLSSKRGEKCIFRLYFLPFCPSPFSLSLFLSLFSPLFDSLISPTTLLLNSFCWRNCPSIADRNEPAIWPKISHGTRKSDFFLKTYPTQTYRQNLFTYDNISYFFIALMKTLDLEDKAAKIIRKIIYCEIVESFSLFKGMWYLGWLPYRVEILGA